MHRFSLSVRTSIYLGLSIGCRGTTNKQDACEPAAGNREARKKTRTTDKIIVRACSLSRPPARLLQSPGYVPGAQSLLISQVPALHPLTNIPVCMLALGTGNHSSDYF